MDLIINEDSNHVTLQAKEIISQGLGILNLLTCLGYDPLNLPIADLLRTDKNLEGDWLVLSPIHWQASHNDAMIIATGKELELSESESLLSYNLLSDFLAEEGMTLHYYDANTWLLLVSDKAPLKHAKSVYQVVNCSLMPELEKLDPTMYWQRFFTECQMFFATHADKSVINGVWPWGAGKLTDKKSVSICAEEQFISLAGICSTQVKVYNPTLNLKDFDIILLNEFNTLSVSHQEEIKTRAAHWYWNNLAYYSGNLNWFTRIWRSLTHAH